MWLLCWLSLIQLGMKSVHGMSSGKILGIAIIYLLLLHRDIFYFLTVKHFSYDVVNCPYWDSNPGPLPPTPYLFETLSALSHKLDIIGCFIIPIWKPRFCCQ